MVLVKQEQFDKTWHDAKERLGAPHRFARISRKILALFATTVVTHASRTHTNFVCLPVPVSCTLHIMTSSGAEKELAIAGLSFLPLTSGRAMYWRRTTPRRLSVDWGLYWSLRDIHRHIYIYIPIHIYMYVWKPSH